MQANRRLVCFLASGVLCIVLDPALAPPARAASPVITEADVLTASDRVPGEFDGFGFWVAAVGDRAVIGAPFDDDLGTSAGAVYVFERDAGTGVWIETVKLFASDGGAGDLLGRYVAIDGDRLVAGAPGAEAAYLFDRLPVPIDGASGAWVETAKLTADDPGPDREFGFSVAVSGDRIAVGANFDDEAADEAGAVYVFAPAPLEAAGPSWAQVAKLLGSAPSAFARLGGRLAFDGTTLAATAPGDTNAAGSVAGATYVFERDLGGPESWGERVKLLGPGPTAVAGAGVALEGDRLVVGAPFDAATSTNGGSAQVFHRNAGCPDCWGETDTLTAVGDGDQDRFGIAAATVGGRTAVAAQFTDTPVAAAAGAVHVFGLRPNGELKPVTVLATSDGTNSQTFAQAVALGGDSLLLAAPAGEGRVYVFDLGRVLLTDGFETGDLESWSAATTGSPP